MLSKLQNHRGSVSVFLVIVLVPMIACASLFVDASRVKSARGLVSSAGDLTLNTVLSQYDVDLNDFYGLMASAQDMDEVINAAGDYFTACIKSQGIDTTDAAHYLNSIKGFFFGDDDVKDLLGIDLADESTVSVTPVADGSLTNPALVKTQIVEFMKYRSPINSIVALFEKFQKSATELENSSKTSDLVDKKQEYYEAQGEVAEAAYKVYEKIVEYDKLGITASDLQEIKNLLNGIEDKYKNLHIKMVKDLYNTQGASDKTIRSCFTIPTSYSHNSKYNNASANQIKKQIDSLMRAYDQFISARNSFENNVKMYSTSGNKYYDIQYWAYCCKNKSYFEAVFSKEKNLSDSFINLWDMIDHAAEGATEELYTCTYTSSNLGVTKNITSKSLQDWFDFLNPKIDAAARSVSSYDSKYNKIVVQIKEHTLNPYDRISTANTERELAELYNQLNDYATRYKKGFDLLGDIVKGLSTLKKKVVTADNKFDTWESTANNYSSTGIELAVSDKKEIDQVKKDYAKLKTSDIDDYSDHINNVKSALGTVTNGIKKIKYNDQSIVEKKINGYNAFKKNSDVLESEIPMFEADLNSYADTKSGSNPNGTFVFSMEGVEIQSLNFTANNDPKIRDEKYIVYKWMKEQGFEDPKDEAEENRYKETKKKADKQADSADTEVSGDVASKNDISTLSGLPSGTSADLDAGKITTKVKDVSKFVGKLFNNFGNTVASAGGDLRDDLFVLDYITSMFTWQTYEYEAKYNMLDKNQQRDINYDTASSVFAGKNTAWQSKEVTQKYNKTITNKLRNSEATNWSYCNEVEYIMYGKSIEECKKALNGSIFMIRFALNLPIIFSTFYNDSDDPLGLYWFANGVNLATHGIIPAGLVKVVICLGLTALESAKDINTLKHGIPVILVKTKKEDLFVETWYFDFRNNPDTDKTSAITFSYSDYMKLILFLKLLGSEAYNIYGRIADVVQTNMSKCVLKDDAYSLSKSQVYYSITANLKVRPLMLDTGYVLSFIPDAAQKMDSWNSISYETIRGY